MHPEIDMINREPDKEQFGLTASKIKMDQKLPGGK